jgi:hypothetical protein
MKESHISRNPRGRFDIPGKRAVELDLGDNDHTKYVVVKKELDSSLPETYDGVKIEWLTAFGVRRKKTDGTPGDYANIKYAVFMDELPSGKRLFTYYGGKVHELSPKTSAGKTRVDFTVGDPPLGWGP